MTTESQALSASSSGSSSSLLDSLRTYKPEQGRYVRLSAFWGLTVLWFYGCFRLAETLADLRYEWASSLRTKIVEELPLVEWPVTPAILIAGLVFLAGMAVFQFWLNRPHVADLLIETEAELKKVTWPTMPDTASSSLIVLITVLVIFLLVAVYDFGLSQLIDKLLY